MLGSGLGGIIAGSNSRNLFLMNFYSGAAGVSNFYAYSYDGKAWVAPASGVPYSSQGSLLHTSFGKGRWVGVSQNNVRSGNGVSWTNSATVLSNNGDMIFANNGWIGTTGVNVYKSSDGDIWTGAYGIPQDSGSYSSAAVELAYGASIYVAIGSYNFYDRAAKIWSSPDGETWTSRLTVASAGSSYQFSKVLFANNMFLAMGNSMTYYSANGTGWALTTPSPALPRVLKYRNSKFLAGGIGGTGQGGLWHSTNGTSWTNASIPQCIGVDYGNSVYVAVDQNIIKYSSDLSTWTTALTITDYGAFGAVEDVTFANGVFIVKGYDSTSINVYNHWIRWSTDGITWTKVSIPVDTRCLYAEITNNF